MTTPDPFVPVDRAREFLRPAKPWHARSAPAASVASSSDGAAEETPAAVASSPKAPSALEIIESMTPEERHAFTNAYFTRAAEEADAIGEEPEATDRPEESDEISDTWADEE